LSDPYNTFTYDVTTDAGKVRLLIPDNKANAWVFADIEIATFLGLETGIKRAAALALETIASNEALVLKVIKLLDVQTDGAKVSDALLARAAKLRAQADVDDENGVSNGFEIIGMVVDDFTWRQAVFAEGYRYLY